MSFLSSIGLGSLEDAAATAWGAASSGLVQGADAVAGGTTYAANTVAGGVVYAADQTQSGLVSAAGTVSTGSIAAWKATSSTAANVADSAAAVGLVVKQGMIVGTNYAVEYGKVGVDATGKGLVAAGRYISAHACDIAVGSALSAAFVSLAADGEEPVTFGALSAAALAADKTAIKTASTAVAVLIAEAVYSIPGVSGAVGHKADFIAVLAWFINKTATKDPQTVGGSGGQVIAGLLIALITRMVCEGEIPKIEDPTAVLRANWNPDPVSPSAPTVWSEGSRIHFNGAFCLILDGKVRPIPSGDVYNRLFPSPWTYIEVDPSTQVLGAALSNDARLVQEQSGSKIFLINDGVRRWINSPAAFQRYGFNMHAVRIASSPEMTTPHAGERGFIPTWTIPEGNPIALYSKPEGSRMRSSAGTVFLVLDGVARPIPNAETYFKLFANWDGIADVDPATIAIGPMITDGAYLGQDDNQTTCLMIDGKKRAILNPDAFNRYHFDWSKVVRLTPQVQSATPIGPVIA